MNLFVVARGDRQVDRYLNIAVRRALVFFIHEYRIVSVNKYFSMACAIVRSANICMSPLQHVLHRFFSRVSVYIVFIRTEPDVTLAETGDEYFDLIPPIFNAVVLYAFNFRYGRLAFVTEREVSNFPDKGKGTFFFLRIFFYPLRVFVPRNFLTWTKVTGKTTLIFLNNVLRLFETISSNEILLYFKIIYSINCLAGPPPLNQILMNKLYNNALVMRSQNPQKKFCFHFV